MYISSADPVVYSRRKQEASYGSEEHYHSVYEFYYLLSGSRRIFADGNLYNLNKGDLMLIPKNATTLHKAQKRILNVFVFVLQTSVYHLS